MLDSAHTRMSIRQARLWDAIRIQPEKWAQDPWGVEGGGFWVVAIIGNTVIWYNDIEEGFNTSNYERYGVINEYWCNQDDLEHVVYRILSLVGEQASGTASVWELRRGPPEPMN